MSEDQEEAELEESNEEHEHEQDDGDSDCYDCGKYCPGDTDEDGLIEWDYSSRPGRADMLCKACYDIRVSKLVSCDVCGKPCDEEESVYWQDTEQSLERDRERISCQNCYENRNNFNCGKCQQTWDKEEMTEVDGELYCLECTTCCMECDKVVLLDQAHWKDDVESFCSDECLEKFKEAA